MVTSDATVAESEASRVPVEVILSKEKNMLSAQIKNALYSSLLGGSRRDVTLEAVKVNQQPEALNERASKGVDTTVESADAGPDSGNIRLDLGCGTLVDGGSQRDTGKESNNESRGKLHFQQQRILVLGNFEEGEDILLYHLAV